MANTQRLNQLLANTYALYLKTQNYHWHVTGPFFKLYHDLFETHYNELFQAVDEIAERVRTLGGMAAATFSEFNQLKTIDDGNARFSASEMVEDLAKSHQVLLDQLGDALRFYSEASDEGSVALIDERIAAHEKMRWMLASSM